MSDDGSQGAAVIAMEFEGYVGTPYDDGTGTWTQGYGSIRIGGTGPARVAQDSPPIDEPTAKSWMVAELAVCAKQVAAAVTVPLTDDEKAALDDFVYNLGAGNLASSTLLRLLNAGDYAGAAAQFDRWDYAGGKPLAGLLRRRQAEVDVFNGGSAASA